MAKPSLWEARIGRRIRPHDLHAFAAVVQSGSISSAAAELGVTQSAVSQMIADLEAGLDLPNISMRTLPVHMRTNLLATGDFIATLPRTGRRRMPGLSGSGGAFRAAVGTAIVAATKNMCRGGYLHDATGDSRHQPPPLSAILRGLAAFGFRRAGRSCRGSSLQMARSDDVGASRQRRVDQEP